MKEFRITRDEVKGLCTLLKEDLTTAGHRKCDISLEQKVLISFKSLVIGSFQNSSKDCEGVSQPVVSKVLDAFVNPMIKNAPQFIYMPRTRRERQEVKQKFYDVANFPGILGCIDGTHVPIIAPAEDEQLFINRKNFHSINVQAICNADGCSTDVIAKWPGSTHDSFILQASRVHDRFEASEFGEGWSLGDSGYPLRSWLMTPINHPHSPAEHTYNAAHKTTRCVIERCFRILKSRFRILDHTGGTLCHKPAKVCKIILTCCILHNICRHNGTPILDSSTEYPLPIEDNEGADLRPSTGGQRQREKLVATFE